MSNEGDYKKYERLVRDILEREIRSDAPAARISVDDDQKLPGRSGAMHQVDVVADVWIAGLQFRVIAECKFRSTRPVEKRDVLALSKTMEEIGAHKGLIVTTIGFQEGAETVAESYKIGLVTLDLDSPHSWKVVLPLGLALLLPRDTFGALTTLTRSSRVAPAMDTSDDRLRPAGPERARLGDDELARSPRAEPVKIPPLLVMGVVGTAGGELQCWLKTFDPLIQAWTVSEGAIGTLDDLSTDIRQFVDDQLGGSSSLIELKKKNVDTTFLRQLKVKGDTLARRALGEDGLMRFRNLLHGVEVLVVQGVAAEAIPWELLYLTEEGQFVGDLVTVVRHAEAANPRWPTAHARNARVT